MPLNFHQMFYQHSCTQGKCQCVLMLHPERFFFKNHWPYSNRDQDTKPNSRSSSILQFTKSWLEGHRYFCTVKTNLESPFWNMGVPKTTVNIQIKIRMPTSENNLRHSPNPKIRTWWTWMFFASSNSFLRSKFWNMGVSKLSDHIQFKMKMNWDQLELMLKFILWKIFV